MLSTERRYIGDMRNMVAIFEPQFFKRVIIHMYAIDTILCHWFTRSSNTTNCFAAIIPHYATLLDTLLELSFNGGMYLTKSHVRSYGDDDHDEGSINFYKWMSQPKNSNSLPAQKCFFLNFPSVSSLRIYL